MEDDLTPRTPHSRTATVSLRFLSAFDYTSLRPFNTQSEALVNV